MSDASPLLKFEDSQHYFPPADDQMLFGLELDEFNEESYINWPTQPEYSLPAAQYHYNDPLDMSPTPFNAPPFYDAHHSPQSSQSHDANSFYNHWGSDRDASPMLSPTSPLSIPSSSLSDAMGPSHSFYTSYQDQQAYPQSSSFSPASFAAQHPLPQSAPSDEHFHDSQRLGHRPISAQDFVVPQPPPQQPPWGSDFYRSPSSPVRTTIPLRHSSRHSPMSDAPQRHHRAASRSLGQIFQSSSAPTTAFKDRSPSLTRSHSRRAETTSEENIITNNDATVRKKKRASLQEPPLSGSSVAPALSSSSHTIIAPPPKSMLHPPKLAPSAWQLYFTDWIQRQQATSSRKLNVAQAAKEAGIEYALLTPEEKDPYIRSSQAAKDRRELEMQAYMRTLTPDDIKKENTFRASQRKLGKSRKSNIKDVNSPKRPLSAYFMFLQRIRSDPQLVAEIFGEETETTKQSVLAAAKWRSMTDDERKPFLARAEQEKLDYEAAKRAYEEGTSGTNSAGYEASSINFSILPGSSYRSGPSNVKIESDDSEGFTTDSGSDGHNIYRR